MTNTTEVTALYRSLLTNATMAEITAAATWYAEAQGIAREMALTSGYTLEQCASVIASFSPRCPWDRNVFLATEFINGNKVATLTNNIKMATNSISKGFDALNGCKTNSFARNIAGDLNAVTIDVWMVRAAGMNPKKTPNKTEYTMLSNAVIELATEFGIAPAQMQALLWVRVRGSAV